MEMQHPEASLVLISSTRGTPEGHYALSMLRPSDDMAARRQEPSPAHSRYVESHNARLAQGARRLGPYLAGKDLLGNSDLDNHGQHPRIQDI